MTFLREFPADLPKKCEPPNQRRRFKEIKVIVEVTVSEIKEKEEALAGGAPDRGGIAIARSDGFNCKRPGATGGRFIVGTEFDRAVLRSGTFLNVSARSR